jgi:predicted dehydrogenase/threonine dehydrogenase-like Zn-dependent dehydrogenase
VKQVVQNLRTGDTELANVPSPSAGANQLLIRTSCSLISTGTERMLVEFGKANPIEKARQQPDKVRMVLDKINTDGLLPTIDAVRNKLDQPLPLGYCNVGRVLEVGAGAEGFAVGDRVATNGKHAEVVSVPVNLCARIPATVTDDAAAFTVIGAIALQGIRLAEPTLGEAVVVTGLGLIGQMAVQLLRAHGCRVLAIDLEPGRLELARSQGAETVDLSKGEDPIVAADLFSRGRGIDAVVVTAATKSSEPISQAARMCRKRGRIVLVGVTGLELSRADFYAKELSFQVSCSYGPGRHDPNYEDKGQDYPIGFVRWTEQRNFEAVLDMMADGRLDVSRLVSDRVRFDDAQHAYQLLRNDQAPLGILLEYSSLADQTDASLRRRSVALSASPQAPIEQAGAARRAVVAFIGAGNYSTAVLIPAFKAAGAQLSVIASLSGLSSSHAGRKFGFEEATTDTKSAIANPTINTVVIATRHDSHAAFVCEALAAGKHVFVEKPLATTLEELSEIEAAGNGPPRTPILMVGFNRRFAPQVQKIKELLEETRAPKAFVMTVNAGAVPADHWTQDPNVGGGRILGEGCHFVDLLRYLAGAPITAHRVSSLNAGRSTDTTTIQLAFGDGSLGTIHYFANGSKSFPKERLEVFVAGRVLQLDNFRKLRGYGWPGFRSMNLWRQDKGQRACAQAFVNAVRSGGASPIPIEELLEVGRVTVELANASG